MNCSLMFCTSAAGIDVAHTITAFPRKLSHQRRNDCGHIPCRTCQWNIRDAIAVIKSAPGLLPFDRMPGARLRLVGHNPHAAGVRPAPRERCPSIGAAGDGLPEYPRRAVLRLAALTNARHRRRQAPAAEPSQLASRGESRRRLLA